MSKIPNQPNQPEDGPGFAPARSFFGHCTPNWISAWPSGWVAVLLLCTGLAKPAAQPVDGNAIPARLAKRSLLLDVHGRGERAVAVGERGHILLSTDSGINWRQVAAPTRRTLTGVFLIDDQSRLGGRPSVGDFKIRRRWRNMGQGQRRK